jgi:hypothetical protein
MFHGKFVALVEVQLVAKTNSQCRCERDGC